MQDDGNFIAFGQDIDPVVDAVLGERDRQRSDQKLPPIERKKKARERAKIKGRRERRVTYDLPPDLRKQLASIAEEKRVPASQLVTWLLTRALEQYGGSASELRDVLDPYLVPSYSPRYEWNLHRYPTGEGK